MPLGSSLLPVRAQDVRPGRGLAFLRLARSPRTVWPRAVLRAGPRSVFLGFFLRGGCRGRPGLSLASCGAVSTSAPVSPWRSCGAASASPSWGRRAMTRTSAGTGSWPSGHAWAAVSMILRAMLSVVPISRASSPWSSGAAAIQNLMKPDTPAWPGSRRSRHRPRPGRASGRSSSQPHSGPGSPPGRVHALLKQAAALTIGWEMTNRPGSPVLSATSLPAVCRAMIPLTYCDAVVEVEVTDERGPGEERQQDDGACQPVG